MTENNDWDMGADVPEAPEVEEMTASQALAAHFDAISAILREMAPGAHRALAMNKIDGTRHYALRAAQD